MTGPSFATPAAAPAATAIPHPAHHKVPPRPAAPKPGDKPDDGGGMRILTYLRLHWLMIVFCGTLLGAGAALLAWDLLASKYESYALLQVSSAQTPIGNQGNANQVRTDFSTYVKTTAALIKSEFVLNTALRDIKDLPTIKEQKEPLKYLDEELLVTWQDGSEVVRITFKGREPQDAKKIVDAVQKAFMAEVVQKDIDDKKAFLKKVDAAKSEIERLLKPWEKSPKAAEVIPAGGTTTTPAPGMLPADVIARVNPGILINRVATLQAEIERLPLTIGEYRRRETLLKEKLITLQDLARTPIPQQTKDAVDRDQEVITQKLKMIRAKTDYEFRSNAADDKNAPGIIQLKVKYESEQARYEELRQQKINEFDGGKRMAEARLLAKELEEVLNGAQKHEEQLKAAKEILAKAEKQLLELPLPADKMGGLTQAGFKEKEYSISGSNLETIDNIYRRLLLQYHQTSLELTSPARVKELQPGSAPMQKDTKKQVMGTVFAGLMGFVLMAAGVVGFETVSRRVSSLADVKAAVTAPVVGVIPARPGEAAASRAAANEAIDKLRAYVSQTWLSRGATAIAVTSPIGDEGKAFAAFGLASSLAQAGYKTLLVDFDLREPVLHTHAGLPNLAGVCELLRAETDARSAVQFLPSGLHMLPAGKWSDEARKAVTGEKLEALLARLKEPYDCVVIHGHALLTAAEAVEVARRCEVVLVCARYRETATPLLKRAAERVATMEIPFSGVVYVGATEQEALC